MYQGFYQLTSGILTQQRNLNTISNNMANTQTSGYKGQTQVDSTFQEALWVRTGRTNKKNPTSLDTRSTISTASTVYTDYSQGTLKETGGTYDFALEEDGFFAVQTQNGVQYTRNGAFSVNADGQLVLDNIGTVLGADGNPITVPDENFTVDEDGTFRDQDGNAFGQLQVTGFADNNALARQDNGMYTGIGGTNLTGQTKVSWQHLEQSNVDMTQEMVNMLSAQRSLQSTAQMLRMYDTVLGQACDEVGKL
jgi:flagellar basal-body rod protein FlgF